MSAERSKTSNFDGAMTPEHRFSNRPTMPHEVMDDGDLQHVRNLTRKLTDLAKGVAGVGKNVERAVNRAMGTGTKVPLQRVLDAELHHIAPEVLAEQKLDPTDPQGVRTIPRFTRDQAVFTEEGLQWLNRVWRANSGVDIREQIRRLDEMSGDERLTEFEVAVYQRYAFKQLEMAMFRELSNMFRSDRYSHEQLRNQIDYFKNHFETPFNESPYLRDFPMLLLVKSQNYMWDQDRNGLNVTRTEFAYLASDAQRRVNDLAKFLKWHDPVMDTRTGKYESVREVLAELGDGSTVFDKFVFYDKNQLGADGKPIQVTQFADTTGALVTISGRVYFDDERKVFIDESTGAVLRIPSHIQYINAGRTLADVILGDQKREEASLVRVATFLFLESMFVMPTATPDRIKYDIDQKAVEGDFANARVNQVLATRLTSFAPAPVAVLYPILARHKVAPIAEEVPYDIAIGTKKKKKEHKFASTGKVIVGWQAEIGDFFAKAGFKPKDISELEDEEIDEKYGDFPAYPVVAGKLQAGYKFIEALSGVLRERGSRRARSFDIYKIIVRDNAMSGISDPTERRKAFAHITERMAERETQAFFKSGVTIPDVIHDLNAIAETDWDLAGNFGLIYGPNRIPEGRLQRNLLAPEALRIIVSQFKDANLFLESTFRNDPPLTPEQEQAGVVWLSAKDKWQIAKELDADIDKNPKTQGLLIGLKARLWHDFNLFQSGKVSFEDLLTFVGMRVVGQIEADGTDNRRIELWPEKSAEWQRYMAEITEASADAVIDLANPYMGLGADKYQMLRRFANVGIDSRNAPIEGVDAMRVIRGLSDIDGEIRDAVFAWITYFHADHGYRLGQLEESARLQLRKGWIDVDGKESFAGIEGQNAVKKLIKRELVGNHWGPLIDIPRAVQDYYDTVGGLPIGLVADEKTAREYLGYREDILPGNVKIRTIRAAHPDHLDQNLPKEVRQALRGRVSYDAYLAHKVGRQEIDRYTCVAQGSKDIWSTDRGPCDPAHTNMIYHFPRPLISMTPHFWDEMARRNALPVFEERYGRKCDESDLKDLEWLELLKNEYAERTSAYKEIATPVDLAEVWYWMRFKPDMQWINQAVYEQMCQVWGCQGELRQEGNELIPVSGPIRLYEKTRMIHRIENRKGVNAIIGAEDKAVQKQVGRFAGMFAKQASIIPGAGELITDAADQLNNAATTDTVGRLAARNVGGVIALAGANYVAVANGLMTAALWQEIAMIGLPIAFGAAWLRGHDPGAERGGWSKLRGYSLYIPGTSWRLHYDEGAIVKRRAMSELVQGRGCWDISRDVGALTRSNNPNDNIILSARNQYNKNHSVANIVVLT